jgi:hypothetical protein
VCADEFLNPYTFVRWLVLRNESSVTYSAFMRPVTAARAGRNG